MFRDLRLRAWGLGSRVILKGSGLGIRGVQGPMGYLGYMPTDTNVGVFLLLPGETERT